MNDNILHAIADLQKAEEKLFSQNKLLTENGEHFKSWLDMLTIQYNNLKNEVWDLCCRMNSLGNRVHTLESNPTYISSLGFFIDTLHEFTERVKFKFNDIVRGFPESTSSDIY